MAETDTYANYINPPESSIPVTEIDVLGPVVKHNHISYVPWGHVSHAPGVGTGNLAYVPDFLLSAPEYFAGNATKRRDNWPQITWHAPMIVGIPQRLEGIGGLTAGQNVMQSLLGVQQANDLDLEYAAMIR
jgi:hypothetical protein